MSLSAHGRPRVSSASPTSRPLNSAGAGAVPVRIPATAPDRLDLAVTDPETGELLGEVVLHEYDPAAGSCTFRTLIGLRGRGHGFGQLALRSTQLEGYGHNARARRVYEKAGFAVEGVRREVQRRDGEWADEVIMSILDREWAALGSDALSPTAR